MFRNPRENVTRGSVDRALPSIGRAPTPPAQESKYFLSPAMTTNAPPQKIQTPVPSRQAPARMASAKKTVTKQNQSILSFFGKAEKNDAVNGDADAASLFFDDRKAQNAQLLSPEKSNSSFTAESPLGSRFNEDDTPVKKRRLDNESNDFRIRTPSPEREIPVEKDAEVEAAIEKSRKPTPKRRGGFVDDSDDDDVGEH